VSRRTEVLVQDLVAVGRDALAQELALWSSVSPGLIPPPVLTGAHVTELGRHLQIDDVRALPLLKKGWSAVLDPREQVIIFGRCLLRQRASLRVLAKALRISHERVRQLERRCKRKLLLYLDPATRGWVHAGPGQVLLELANDLSLERRHPRR